MHDFNDLICDVFNNLATILHPFYLRLIFERRTYMRKILNRISSAPKRLKALVLMAVVAVTAPAAVLAWGPDRELFTMEEPASYVTFNSITNNPTHGDERNFVQVKQSDASNSTYADSIALTPGKKYSVYVYYHNNAADSYNASGEGIAKDSFARVEIPGVVKSGDKNTKAVGYVGASNATPKQVWDDISFSNPTNGDIALRYVPGSAKIYSNGAVDGKTVSDSIVTTGAPLGYDKLDGNLPGCNEYAGYIIFEIMADQPNFTIDKTVRLEGATDWKESVNAKPGDTVEYQIRYANTGTTRQSDVVLKDALPENMEYIKGSTWLKNSNFPNAKNVSDRLVSNTGINIGSYLPGGVGYVKFSAKVSSDYEKFCEVTTLKNVARVETNNGSKSDDANVVVKTDKSCEEKPEECKPGIPVGDERCEETPETPEELPQTGADSIVAIAGLGATVASAAYYAASRRALN